MFVNFKYLKQFKISFQMFSAYKIILYSGSSTDADAPLELAMSRWLEETRTVSRNWTYAISILHSNYCVVMY